MTEVAKMTVGLGADIQDLVASFNKISSQLSAFAGRIEDEFSHIGSSVEQSLSNILPKDLASAARDLGLSASDPLIKIMNETADIIHAELERAFENDANLAKLGKEGGAAFTKALELEIARISQSPVIQQQLQRMQKEVAQRAPALRIAQSFRDAEQNAARMATTVDRAAAATGRLANTSTRLTGVQGRLANASISVAFALDGILAGGDRAEAGLSKVLRSVAVLAPAFGASGLLVSGVAAATNAIVGLFTRAREEMEKTRQTFADEMGKMVRNVDALGLQKMMQDILLGDPGKGASQFAEGFKDGLNDVAARLFLIRERMKGLSPRTDQWKELNEQLQAGKKIFDQQIDQLRQLQDAALNLKELAGGEPAFAPPIGIKGKSDAAQALDELERMQKRAAALLQQQSLQQEAAARRLADIQKFIFKDAESGMQGLPQAVAKLYGVALQMAEKFADKTSPLAMGWKQLAADLRAAGEAARRDIEAVQRGVATLLFGAPEPKFKTDFKKLPTIEIQAQLTPPPTENLLSITQAINRVLTARGALDIAEQVGDDTLTKKVQKDLTSARALLVNYGRIAFEQFNAGTISAEQFRTVIQQINSALGDGPKQIETLSDKISAAVQAAQGLLNIADGMGRIGDRARQAVQGVLSLVTAIQTLVSAKGSLSGILSGSIGALGALAQIGGSLFGESPEEKAAREEAIRIQRENTEAVEKLAASLRAAADSLGGRQNVAGFVAEAARLQARPEFVPQDQRVNEFLALLKKFNIEWGDVVRVAEESGIQLKDFASLFGPTAQAFAEAIALQIQHLTRFGQSVDEQRAKLQLRGEVFDIDQTPAQKFNDQLTLLATQSEKLHDLFKGIDVSTAAGREAAEAILRNLVERLEAGTITAEEFDKFGGKDAFIQWLLDADRALDSFVDSVDSASATMLNVPKVLKAFQLAFQAQRASSELPSTPTTTTFNPFDVAAAARAADVQPVEPVTFNFASGAIVIHADGGDPRTIATTVLGELQTIARARLGDRRRWAELN